MDVVQKITQAIEPSLAAMGYEVVLLKMTDNARRKTLMVMAERTDEQNMSFDDCTEISRIISALLDVEDPINGAYDLEVCSPGIDRPLTKPRDFTRFAGLEAKLETLLPVEGRKRFRGIIKGIEKEIIILAMPEGEVKIPFQSLRNAKLLVTDGLMSNPPKKPKKKKAH